MTFIYFVKILKSDEEFGNESHKTPNVTAQSPRSCNHLHFFHYLDFKTATDTKVDNDQTAPIHENVVRNFANIEIFDCDDENKEDTLGWITIMENCESDLQRALKLESLNLDERKKIANGIVSGLKYLEYIGIRHLDRKLTNFLLIGDVVKVCDFGLVEVKSKREGYRMMGYARRGSKYRSERALRRFHGVKIFLNVHLRGRNSWIRQTSSNNWTWLFS